MPMAGEASARIQAWTTAAKALLVDIRQRVVRELGLIVDIVGWRQATTWKDRLGSVSWVRAGVLGTTASIIAGGVILYAVTRPIAYPPPERTAREIALYDAAVKNASRTPPAGLVAANQPLKPE